MIGQRIGMLTVTKEVEKRPGSGSKRYECLCDCGNLTAVDAGNLRKETTRSCGCIRKARGASMLTKHGYRFHPAYSRWNAMIGRCYSEKHAGYENYGGRGITVCDDWRSSPVAFLQWADQSGFEHHLQLDRQDNEGGYSPENCRWVTRSVNNKNRRKIKRGGQKIVS